MSTRITSVQDGMAQHKAILEAARVLAKTYYRRSFDLVNDPAYDQEDLQQQIILWYLEWRKSHEDKIQAIHGSEVDLFRYWSSGETVWHEIINWTKSKSFGHMTRYGHSDEEEIEMVGLDDIDDEFEAPDPAEEVEKRDWINYCLDRAKDILTENQYNVYDMYLGGATNRQIAEEFGISPQRVGQLVKLTTAKMRKVLDESAD
jgi:RNA polymerase sigma factor (sigma-70 family)